MPQHKYGVGWYTSKKRKTYICEQFDTIDEVNRKVVRLQTIERIPEKRIHIFKIGR